VAPVTVALEYNTLLEVWSGLVYALHTLVEPVILLGVAGADVPELLTDKLLVDPVPQLFTEATVIVPEVNVL